jgi:hypothetical protein
MSLTRKRLRSLAKQEARRLKKAMRPFEPPAAMITALAQLSSTQKLVMQRLEKLEADVQKQLDDHKFELQELKHLREKSLGLPRILDLSRSERREIGRKGQRS